MIRSMMAYLLAPAVILFNSACTNGSDHPYRPPQGKAAASFDLDGKHYEIVDGKLYDGKGRFLQDVYDPDFERKHYVTEGGKTFRLISGGSARLPVFTRFTEGFENARSVRDLISAQRGWTSLTVLGPGAPSVEAYSHLRQRILQNGADFKDNRVEPTASRAHSGRQALRTYSVSGPRSMDVLKASLSNELFHCGRGERLVFSGWFFLERGMPISLVDLESSYIEKGSGIRLMLDAQGRPRVELKWPTRPTYHGGKGVRIKTQAWTHVELRLALAADASGHIQLLLDGEKVIDAAGQTLPLADSIYDRLEVGITSTPPGMETVVYVDDIDLHVTR